MTFTDLPSAQRLPDETDREYVDRMRQRLLDDFKKVGAERFLEQGKQLPMYSNNYDNDDNLEPAEKDPLMTRNEYTWYVPYILYDSDDYAGFRNGRYHYDWDADEKAEKRYKDACLRCEAMKKAVRAVNRSGKTEKYLHFNNNCHYTPMIDVYVANCGAEVKDDYWSLFKLKMNQGLGAVKRSIFG